MKGKKTIWQFIKFLLVSGIVSIIQLVLVNLLFYLMRQWKAPLPGFLRTDWTSTGPGQGTAAGAIAAGNDLIMPGSGRDKRNILAGLRSGELTPEALRTAAGNVIDAIRKGTK